MRGQVSPVPHQDSTRAGQRTVSRHDPGEGRRQARRGHGQTFRDQRVTYVLPVDGESSASSAPVALAIRNRALSTRAADVGQIDRAAVQKLYQSSGRAIAPSHIRPDTSLLAARSRAYQTRQAGTPGPPCVSPSLRSIGSAKATVEAKRTLQANASAIVIGPSVRPGAHVERSRNHNCITSFLHVTLVENGNP